MKKLLVLLLGLGLFLFLNLGLVNAQETQTTPQNEEITISTGKSFREGGAAGYGEAVQNTDATGRSNLESVFGYTATVVFPMAVNESLVGWDGKSLTAKKFQKSVLGQTSQAMTFLYQERPVSTMEYLAWMGERIGFIPKTYAQGVTFSRLLPILPIWKAFRDIAFIMLAIIMLMIGVMIMFRAKVNPQTVANVENTIPKVIVTIILIWFSFPIASLIIDFMYVIIAAGIGVIGNVKNPSTGLPIDPTFTQSISDYSTGGFMTLAGKTLAPTWEFAKIGGLGTATSTVGIASTVIGVLSPAAIVAVPVGLIILAITGGLTGVSSGDAGTGLMTMLSPIFVLLIFLVLFFQIFKIFFILLNAYIQILISIIIAPVYLLANAIPGKDTFTSWWKGIVANMLSFVVTALMLYLGWAIASLVGNQSLWTPPFIIASGGMLAGAMSQALVGLIALGIVLLIPQVIGMVKQALGVKPLFNVGPGMLVSPITTTAQSGLGIAGQLHTFQQVTGEGGLANKFIKWFK